MNETNATDFHETYSGGCSCRDDGEPCPYGGCERLPGSLILWRNDIPRISEEERRQRAADRLQKASAAAP